MTASGDLKLEHPSADTLKVVLSGQWKLGGDLPGADELSVLTHGLSTLRIFHCFSVALWTAEKGHKTHYIPSFKFCLRDFNVYNRFIYLHFIPAMETTVVVFFRRRAEGDVYSLHCPFVREPCRTYRL